MPTRAWIPRGHDTLEASDGPSARALARTRPDIELLLTDVVMPNGASGLELARALRRRSPDLPVVLATGHAGELSAADAPLDRGAVLVRKPYDGDALAAALHEAVTGGVNGR